VIEALDEEDEVERVDRREGDDNEDD